jgi:ATP-dependent Clp protease ATP-binding subunit ClpB
VRRRPYAVVLLDEIEKAHSDVFNTLLQVLDDGRITDGQGRTVDFRNTVVIMTSNIGSAYLLDGVSPAGEIKPDARALVLGELNGHFRPEFLNRIDDVVLFRPLAMAQLERIVDLQFDSLRERLAEHRITVRVTDAARGLIAARAYDPVYGARPLRRYIAHEVETRLGRAMLAGDLTDGRLVVLDAADDELLFSYRDQQETAKAA